MSNGSVDECGVLGLLGGSQDQGGVGGSILGLVLADSCVLLAIAHNCRPRKSGRRRPCRSRGIDGWGYILAKSPRKCVSVDLSIYVNSVRRELTRVADDGGAGGLKLLERGRHDGKWSGYRDCTGQLDMNCSRRVKNDGDAEEKKVATRRYLQEGRGI